MSTDKLREALVEAREVLITACGTDAPYIKVALSHIEAALADSGPWQGDNCREYALGHKDGMAWALKLAIDQLEKDAGTAIDALSDVLPEGTLKRKARSRLGLWKSNILALAQPAAAKQEEPVEVEFTHEQFKDALKKHRESGISANVFTDGTDICLNIGDKLPAGIEIGDRVQIALTRSAGAKQETPKDLSWQANQKDAARVAHSPGQPAEGEGK